MGTRSTLNGARKVLRSLCPFWTGYSSPVNGSDTGRSFSSYLCPLWTRTGGSSFQVFTLFDQVGPALRVQLLDLCILWTRWVSLSGLRLFGPDGSSSQVFAYLDQVGPALRSSHIMDRVGPALRSSPVWTRWVKLLDLRLLWTRRAGLFLTYY